MKLLTVARQAFVWLNDPANWRGGSGVLARGAEHLAVTGIAVGLAVAVAVPLGLWLGHTGRGGPLTVVLSNTSRAIPTLALLTIFATIPAIGFGDPATVVALAIFAVPPLLTNTYVGMRGVDRQVIEAARGMGMSGRQLLARVELPLALPLAFAGFRTATVQVVATAPLAALVGGGTLGAIINDGFGNQDQGQIVAGGLLVAALALLVEGLLAGVQRWLVPGAAGRRRRRQVAPAKPAVLAG